jgi:hypothetical protein
VSKEVRNFSEVYKIKLLNLCPYHAQANGQAELSNKILMKPFKKKKSRTILGDGMKFCLKLYGHIAYLYMVLPRLLLLSLYMDKKLCCPWMHKDWLSKMIYLLLCIMI